MNQRITELAAKANATANDVVIFGGENYAGLRDDIFAELIVEECIAICNKIYFERYPDAEDFERSEEGDAIKKHFGVKE